VRARDPWSLRGSVWTCLRVADPNERRRDLQKVCQKKNSPRTTYLYVVESPGRRETPYAVQTSVVKVRSEGPTLLGHDPGQSKGQKNSEFSGGQEGVSDLKWSRLKKSPTTIIRRHGAECTCPGQSKLTEGGVEPEGQLRNVHTRSYTYKCLETKERRTIEIKQRQKKATLAHESLQHRISNFQQCCQPKVHGVVDI